MSQSNEETTTMDNSEQNEDAISGEWTLVDRVLNDDITIKKKIITPEKYFNYSINNDISELAHEAIEVLKESTSLDNEELNEDKEKNTNKSIVQHDENSDRISSVITERNNKSNEFRISEIANIIQPINSIFTPAGTYTHIIVACSLAAIIGFGIGCIIGKGETQISGNDTNFGRTESIKGIERSEQFSDKSIVSNARIKSEAVWKKPKYILEQISNDNKVPMNILNNLKDPNAESIRKIMENVKFTKNILEQMSNDDKSKTNINSKSNFEETSNGSLRDLLDRLKFTLDNLCSMIDDSYKSSKSNEFIAVCDKQYSIMNIIELKDNIQNVLVDLTDPGDPLSELNKRFIDNMELKLKNISLLLIDDLSKTIKESVMKIDRKLNKMQRKLSQKFCLIRNTFVDDVKIQETLNKYNVLDENCSRKKFIYNVEPEIDSTGNFMEKKIYNNKNFHTYSMVPDEKVVKNEHDKFFKSKKVHKSRKNLSKGDFTSERETIEIQKDHVAKKNQRPIALASNNKIKNFHNEKSRTECNSNANTCVKQHINDRNNLRDETYENWQFKRSEGRFNWREKKEEVDDNYETSWVDKRAKSRSKSREKYQVSSYIHT